MAQRPQTRPARQALIITTSPWEQAAVKKYAQDLHEEEEPGGLIFECGVFQGTVTTWKIAILELGLSDLDPIAQTETALRFFGPELALLVGTAFGMGTDVGEVVAATNVVGFASEIPN